MLMDGMQCVQYCLNIDMSIICIECSVGSMSLVLKRRRGANVFNGCIFVVVVLLQEAGAMGFSGSLR